MNTAPRKRLLSALAAVAMTAASTVCGALIAEVGYRAYLNYRIPGRFHKPGDDRNFAAYNVSHWEFDEKFGYVYPPNRVIDMVSLADERVVSCSRLSTINEFGNMGPVSGDWRTAPLKIAVFGDSFTAYLQQGLAWPNVLHKVLEERLQKPVAVMNFGRDGYGLLQMFDLAADKAAEWKPDVVVVAFITDDFTRARFWRSVIGEGDDQRVLTTIDPVRNPGEDRAADTYLLMRSATYEWCKSVAGTGLSDAVTHRLVSKHRRLRERVRDSLVRLWDIRRSFLFDRLWHGNPFWFFDRQLQAARNPRLTYASYAQDERFKQALGRLRASGSRIALFHLAYYPEIKAGKEYLVNAQQASLLKSLESTIGLKPLRTTDYVKLPVDRPERMNESAENFHPSLWGMELYANAVAEALLRENLVEDRRR